MAFARYTALRLLVFAVVVALLWIVTDLRGLMLILIALLVSGVASMFILNRSRKALSAAIVNRQDKIKQRLAERSSAEDAWNDQVRESDEPAATLGNDDARATEQRSDNSAGA